MTPGPDTTTFFGAAAAVRPPSRRSRARRAQSRSAALETPFGELYTSGRTRWTADCSSYDHLSVTPRLTTLRLIPPLIPSCRSRAVDGSDNVTMLIGF